MQLADMKTGIRSAEAKLADPAPCAAAVIGKGFANPILPANEYLQRSIVFFNDHTLVKPAIFHIHAASIGKRLPSIACYIHFCKAILLVGVEL